MQQVDGQVSVSHLVTRAHEFVRRMASRDKSSTALLLAKAKETILKNDLFLSFSTKLLRHITQNLDFAHSHIRAKVKTGLRGTFDAAIHELFAQAPLMVKSSITGGINLGLRPPVPTLVTIQPSFNGEVNIEASSVYFIKAEKYSFNLVLYTGVTRKSKWFRCRRWTKQQ